MTITFWQVWISIVTGAALLLFGALFGSWAVFRTKNAQLGIPFVQTPKLKEEAPHSYVEDLFGEDTPEDEISDAAKRLRAQRGSSSAIADIMASVTGKAT